jgi:WD40 repeat protein
MKLLLSGALSLLLLPVASAQESSSPGQGAPKVFPGSDFVLRDKNVKPQKSGLVLGPPQSDGKGGTKGSFAIYGGGLQIEVSSLSFSGDAKLLAVGSTPGSVDLWDVENRKKLRTLAGGSSVSLTTDGRLLAKDGKGIELYDLASGQLIRTIERPPKKTDNTIQRLEIDPTATFLDVTANGEDDLVYDVSSGKLLATLTDTKHASFSRDGALLFGGNSRHLIVWRTKDWSKVGDFPNGHGYVTATAMFPERDLVVVGSSQMARLLRLSSGEELATVGTGFTHFTAFNESGTLIFTYTSEGFSVWDSSGKRYCSAPHIANGTTAISADGRWLAGGIVEGANSINVWNLPTALAACGVASDKSSQ